MIADALSRVTPLRPEPQDYNMSLNKSQCIHKIQPYWCFRDDITYEDGILYKDIRIIMPQSTWAITLQELHLRHYAVDKMNLRAKEAVYWPGISEDIKATYHKCEKCAKFTRTQQKETLQYVETQQTTWEQLGIDIFTLKTHTPSSVWLLQPVPSCSEITKSTLNDHNQTP